jgi:dipeptide/tripeptide permease
MSGKITGLYLVGGSAGSMFFPWLIGQWFEPIGPQILLILLAIALFLALVIFLIIQLVMNQTKNTNIRR